jgi:YD repeat-containing protein
VIIWGGAGRELVFHQIIRSDGSICFRPGPNTEGIEIQHRGGNYVFTTNRGEEIDFNSSGRMVDGRLPNGARYRLVYSGRKLTSFVYSSDEELRFFYYSSGKVRHVDVLVNGKIRATADYRYDADDNLIYVRNSWTNEYRYEYDDLHNLIHATWPDGTDIRLRYDNVRDWTMMFKDWGDCIEWYDYWETRDGLEHYGSYVTKLDPDGAPLVRSKYEFWHGSGSDRVLSEINEQLIDVHYDALFDRPDQYTVDSLTAHGQFDKDRGLVRVEQTRSRSPPYGGFLLRPISLPADDVPLSPSPER